MSQGAPPHDPAHIESHHDWQSAAYVADWIARDVTRDDERRPRLRWAADLLPLHDAAAPRVLDVGGGYGVFSGELLDVFPRATVCVQDYSAAMLERARENLAGFGERVRFVRADLTDPAWAGAVDGPFDAVISALAIHNLGHDPGGVAAIRSVYAAIHSLLRPGGWFLDQDLVFDVYSAPADAPLARLYARGAATPRHRHAERHHSPQAAAPSLQDHLSWLREAGFGPVDCLHKHLSEVLLAAYRPA